MARNLVTRTIKSTEVEVMCLDTNIGEAINKSITLSGEFANEVEIMKAITKRVNFDEGVVPCKVVHTAVIENLYGMSEETFIANSEILPARKTADKE